MKSAFFFVQYLWQLYIKVFFLFIKILLVVQRRFYFVVCWWIKTFFNSHALACNENILFLASSVRCLPKNCNVISTFPIQVLFILICEKESMITHTCVLMKISRIKVLNCESSIPTHLLRYCLQLSASLIQRCLPFTSLSQIKIFLVWWSLSPLNWSSKDSRPICLVIKD